MRKPDFGSVDGTIAGCFDEGQVIGISRIEDDVIDSLLFHVNRGRWTGYKRRGTLTEFMAGGTREQHTRHQLKRNMASMFYGSFQWRWRGAMAGKVDRECAILQ